LLYVIEHLEPELSEWLLIEYSHAAEVVGRENLLVTNVRRREDLKRLSRVLNVERRRVFKIFRGEELLLLDPAAEKAMCERDARGKRAIVVGGILGDDPPQGRTRKMLTELVRGATVRNIGRHQFSIDGALYVAKRVAEGASLGEVPVRIGVEIELHEGHSVFLPYAYPVVDGKPLLSSRLISYLRKPWRLAVRTAGRSRVPFRAGRAQTRPPQRS